MAVSPNTTNIAVARDVAEQLRGIAKKANMTTLEVANQLLLFAMSQGEIKLEKTQLVIAGGSVAPIKTKTRKRS